MSTLAPQILHTESNRSRTAALCWLRDASAFQLRQLIGLKLLGVVPSTRTTRQSLAPIVGEFLWRPRLLPGPRVGRWDEPKSRRHAHHQSHVNAHGRLCHPPSRSSSYGRSVGQLATRVQCEVFPVKPQHIDIEVDLYKSLLPHRYKNMQVILEPHVPTRSASLELCVLT